VTPNISECVEDYDAPQKRNSASSIFALEITVVRRKNKLQKKQQFLAHLGISYV
jgi:hypothetical protein